jgi:diguanylate cyclase (GGDEF)-like protein
MGKSKKPRDNEGLRDYYRQLSHEELVEKAVILDGIALAALLKKQSERAWINRDLIHDDLTGILNNRGLKQAFAARSEHRFRQADKAKPDLVAVVDLDKFKEINDTFGHKVGNQSLRKVAEMLKTTVREDDIVGRFGGDEFMLFLHNATLDEGVRIGEKIRRYTSMFGQLGNNDVPVPTLSIGIAEVDYTLSFDDMYHKADMAMYEAKRGGRDQVHILLPQTDL